MYNITDYIKWRGDLSFNEAPFNEVDNLIFTQLSYLDFSGIVSQEINNRITLAEAWKKYVLLERKPEGIILPDELYTMFEEMAKSRRFSELNISAYISKIDELSEKQFAAISLSFEKNIYVSFRGTDDNLVGWKEDFNMAFMETVPAQAEAALYLNKVMKKTFNKPVYVGGHSKGGNLSVYAAMHCDKRYKRRIKKVYTNDGPGFLEKIIKSKEYAEISGRIVSIVPEGSVVGQLLSHGKPDDIIVKNESSVLKQHNPFTWSVMGSKFVRAEKLSEQSIAADTVIKSWLSKLDDAERESFADAIYEFFKVSDAKCLKDIFEDKIGFLKSLGKLSKESKKDIGKNIGQIIEEITKIKGKK